jgi:hypothetical protein
VFFFDFLTMDWDYIRKVVPRRRRAPRKVDEYHKFTSPTCIEHLIPGLVYLWVVHHGYMRVCLRHHPKRGTKHIDLSKSQKCQGGGEIMIKKGVVRFNMHSGSFRSQDKRMKGIILDYLRQQDLPVRLMKLKTMKDAR